MALSAGTRLGVYEVVGLLGSGGMGEVYRARDTKLHREVALKVLPDRLAGDPDRLARFEREAQVLASLNHPHIASIYGLEDAPSTGSGPAVRALVLELVEGPTLAEVISGVRLQATGSRPQATGFREAHPKPEALSPRPGHGLPVDDALTIALQIADALGAAHEKGIVHRDLKPANVKVTPEGVVKVLDFGLAKLAMDRSSQVHGSSGEAYTNSPTLMASVPGLILGTAAYMSPEQAKGREADRTSDVWAFGCVLYEMLTGQPVFEGESVSEILAGVLKADPDWSRLPAGTPQGVRRLLRRCLQKDRTNRLHDMADARIELDDARREPEADAPGAPVVSRRKERAAWMAAVALLTVVAAGAIAWALGPRAAAPELRLEVTTPPTSAPASLAISPDGRRLVFVAASTGGPQLWLRPLDAGSAQPLPGTEGASSPFWSPDSRSVGFVADNQLKRIDIEGGLVQSLTKAHYEGSGGSWNRDGTILHAIGGQNGTPILRVAATGGESTPVTRQPQVGTSHLFPQFLPDGEHFLFIATGAAAGRGVYVGQMGSPDTRRLLEADGPAVYWSGHLLFVRQGTLFAQDFNADRLELTGDPSAIAQRVLPRSVSASDAGPIVFRTLAPGSGQRQLVWFDRSGKEMEKVGGPIGGGYAPNMSPDGRRVVMGAVVNGNPDIYLLDIGRGVFSRFTFDGANDAHPIWSPDGSRIVFLSNRKSGVQDLYLKTATGAGSEELLLASSRFKIPNDWSPDGRYLLYHGEPDATLRGSIWALPLEGDRKPFEVVQASFEQGAAQFSPDGKWIAYQSDESGRFEIYIQPFPGPGGKWQVSPNGGLQVRWRRDGKELFYVSLDSRLMAVPIQLDVRAQTVEAGMPVPLFLARIGGGPVQSRPQYVAAPDGQRFLVITEAEEAASPITVILNWKAKP